MTEPTPRTEALTQEQRDDNYAFAIQGLAAQTDVSECAQILARVWNRAIIAEAQARTKALTPCPWCGHPPSGRWPCRRTTSSGTEVVCVAEGVHEHAFRGPHRFREWEPGT